MIAPTYSLCQRAIPSKTKSAMYSDELQNSGSTDLFLSNRTAVEHFILLVSQTIPLRLRFSSSREGRRCRACSAGFSRRIFRCFSCFQCIFPAAFRIFCLHSSLLRLHRFHRRSRLHGKYRQYGQIRQIVNQKQRK